ncbi:MAG TPA: VacJ family lipoprotein [Sphingobium sp.]
MSVSTLAIAMLLSSSPASSDGEQPGTAAAIPATPATPAPAAASPTPAQGDSGTPVPVTADSPAPASGPATTAGIPPALPADAVLPTTAAANSPTIAATADDDADGDPIVVTARRRAIAADPLAGVNAASFEAIQVVDKIVVAPVAGTYAKVVPKPVRNGLRNVLINLAEPIVFLNYLLQFKPGKAAETAGRFALNSTIGVAGLFDMAKRRPFHLPYRQNGFANTFGYHGIGNGPFLFVPILGPTTVRDLVGRVLDLGLIPAVVGRPFNDPAYGLGTGIVKSMNDRVEFDGQIKRARSSADPYAVTRNFYLKRRQAEIDALHSPAYCLRKGIGDPVLPPIQTNPADGPAPTTAPTTSIPGSMGMVPAAPAPAAPVSGTPSLTPAP